MDGGSLSILDGSKDFLSGGHISVALSGVFKWVLGKLGGLDITRG